MRHVTTVISLATLILCFTVAPAAQAQSTTWTTVLSDLNNPRGLAFAPDGSLYVAEAGEGGDGPCISNPSGPTAPDRCYGTTGSIWRVDLRKGTRERVVSALPSLAPEGGAGATGVHDISFQGNRAFFTIGWGGDPANRKEQLAEGGASFGRLGVLLPNGKWSLTADIAQYEQDHPNSDGPDSNPYGVLALPGRTIVADAGGNSLIEIAASGTISTLALIPTGVATNPPPFAGAPFQAVPTSVAVASDGSLYLGQLTGFPFPVGGASVFTVPAEGGTPSPALTGFTNIIDIAVDDDGTLFVLELRRLSLLSPNTEGRLVQVNPDGTRVEIAVLNTDGSNALIEPGGVAISKDGDLFLTINSTSAGDGQVIRLDR